MIRDNTENLRRRVKSLNRILTNLDTEERGLGNQGMIFSEQFKDIRQSIRRIIIGIENELVQKGG